MHKFTHDAFLALCDIKFNVLKWLVLLASLNHDISVSLKANAVQLEFPCTKLETHQVNHCQQEH